MSSPPTTLGQYQIIREIARSNDIVYEAYDPLMNRRVAVKELSMPGGATPQQKEERIARFRREAQAAGTLNHANIMTVYSFAEDSGRTFMAMEYLDGCTLRNELDTKGNMSPDRAVEVATAVLEGLSHAHSKGVIHRDIKPENIQMLSNGQLKITDFGIARLTFQPNLTMDGQVFGTPSYMSPEQVVGREIDARSDIFSVGVMLYEMISGTKPFAGDSVVTITYAIVNREADQPANMSYPMWQVVSKAIEKSPQLRFQSSNEMIAALEEALRPEPSYAPPPVLQSANPYTYGSNTYAPAPPPPMGAYSPPPAPGAVINAPYNPYSAHAANPYQAQPPAPSPSYGYNPYQAGASPVGQPMSMPTPGQVPVYYPPPPRQPLLKPETTAFMKKLVLTFLIVGTLFALIVVAVNALIGAWSQVGATQRDQQTVQRLIQPDSTRPIDDQIRDLEGAIGNLSSDSSKNEANWNLAVLYERKGNDSLKAGDLVGAEKAFLAASEKDSHNPLYFTDLGALYGRQAAAANTDIQKAADLWKQSGDAWQKAMDCQSLQEKRTEYAQQNAYAYYKFASFVAEMGDKDRQKDARTCLLTAEHNATDGSDLKAQITGLLTSLR